MSKCATLVWTLLLCISIGDIMKNTDKEVRDVIENLEPIKELDVDSDKKITVKEKIINVSDKIFEFIIFKIIFGYFDWVASTYQKIENSLKHAEVQN
jgi:hypothetical protein